ncbi:MAG: hypothetical protein B7Z79_12045 [Thiomonas sp. 20-64-9]|nr:MAG: hypothetical protein B7Z79_12045 [Thiomonas sp. 20-64-9]
MGICSPLGKAGVVTLGGFTTGGATVGGTTTGTCGGATTGGATEGMLTAGICGTCGTAGAAGIEGTVNPGWITVGTVGATKAGLDRFSPAPFDMNWGVAPVTEPLSPAFAGGV